MTQNPLSMDFLKNLVKRSELREAGHKPIFTNDELKYIKTVLKERKKNFTMRNRSFTVRYFNWKKQEWVTVRPIMGFVPMFSGPYDEVMKAEII